MTEKVGAEELSVLDEFLLGPGSQTTQAFIPKIPNTSSNMVRGCAGSLLMYMDPWSDCGVFSRNTRGGCDALRN